MVRNTRMRMAVGCISLFANKSKYFFCSIFLFNKFLYAYGVHYRKEGDAYVGKDSFPKCGDSTGTEDEDKQLHSESQRDVLPDNPAGLPARMNGGGHSRRLVCLYHYIGGFDGGIAAKSAHGDAHIG